MAAKSTYLEDKIINYVLRNVAYTAPTTVYLALYTSSPTAADSGTEVTGGSYARQAVTFSASSSGSTSNSGTVTFSGMPAATVTHFGIRDASTAGNLLYWGPLSASKTTSSGDTLTVSASGLTVSES